MTDFTKIVFNQQYHTYTYDGKRLTSVTKQVYSLKPPFDPDGSVTERAAQKAGVTVDVIKSRWEKKRQDSMAYGSVVHEMITKILRGEEPPQDDFTASVTELPEVSAFRNILKEFGKREMRVDKVEWVVGDEVLGLAGTVDALVYSPQTRQYHVVDWKTGSFTTENKFGKLLPPFNDLDDCYLATYTLQLNLYRAIIELNTDLPIGDSYIYHLTPEGAAVAHPVKDEKERLLRWVMDIDTPPSDVVQSP